MTLNISWTEHITNSKLYGDYPKVSQKSSKNIEVIRSLSQNPEEIASNLVLWQPSQGRPNQGRKRTTYIENLLKDTNMQRMEEFCTH